MTFCNLRVSSEESSPEARDAIATSEEFATKISTKILFSEKKKEKHCVLPVFCLWCFFGICAVVPSGIGFRISRN